jgi:hypothetical protein
MPKTPKNLYLDPKVVEAAEEYARKCETNLSHLVSDFLQSLQVEPSDEKKLAPVVRRLIGAGVPRTAKSAQPEVEDYRRYLIRKYGS